MESIENLVHDLNQILKEAKGRPFTVGDRIEIYHLAADLARALEQREAATPPRDVPEGFVLVPRVPTEAMMDAAEACSADWPRTTWKQAWAAMIAAAPSGELG